MRRRRVEGEPEPPTKGELKRRAQALQELGERLITAPQPLLDSLGLPDVLADAVLLARRITSRAGLARQKRYVGKLLREIEVEPILAALDARDAEHSLAARRFHRVERWRDRLVAEGEPAIAALAAQLPEAGDDAFRMLVAAARDPTPPDARARAARQLFRWLATRLQEG